MEISDPSRRAPLQSIMSGPELRELFEEGRRAFASARYPLAAKHFATILQRDPRNTGVMQAMASCLVRMYRFGDAMTLLKAVVRLSPGRPEPLCMMGKIELTCLNDAAATECFKQALAISPGFPLAVSGLTDLYRKLGRQDDAVALVRDAMGRSVRPDPHLAEAYAALAPTMGEEAEAIAYVRSVLATDPDRETRTSLLFLLARLLDQTGAYEQAWEAALEANDLKPVQWDADAYSAAVDRMLAFWTRERLAALPTSGNESESPVFVVGMPRSGSTLIEQIVAAHPEGAGAGELIAMMSIADRLSGKRSQPGQTFLTETTNLTAERLSAESERYLSMAQESARRVGSREGASRLLDKQLDNYQVLPMIQLLFPRAKVVHTLRDPRDVCVSCFFQMFLGPLGFSYNLEHLARYYADHSRIMAHMKEVLDLPILEVRYEELVADPEPQIRQLLDHVGLPFHQGCLSFHTSERSIHTASLDQVRKPIYRSSTQRWKRYGPGLKPLLDALERAGVLPENPGD